MIKILIVEDDFLTLESTKAKLNDLGYINLFTANDSDSAIDVFRQNNIDLIFMDIGLEGSKLNGIELAKELVKENSIPIIFISSYSDQQTLEEVEQTNFSNYLIKPVSARQLFVAINIALSNENNKLDSSDKTNFFIKGTDQYYHNVSTDDILWIAAVRGGIEIVTINKTYILTASLSSFFRQHKIKNLIRIHRSFGININRVTSILEHEIQIIYKNKQKSFVISKKYWNEIKDKFNILRSD